MSKATNHVTDLKKVGTFQADNRVVLVFPTEDDAILFNEVAKMGMADGYRLRVAVEEVDG